MSGTRPSSAASRDIDRMLHSMRLRLLGVQHKQRSVCLSCKGCASDCPTGVDMASYKAEVLHQSYHRRIPLLTGLAATLGQTGQCRTQTRQRRGAPPAGRPRRTGCGRCGPPPKHSTVRTPHLPALVQAQRHYQRRSHHRRRGHTVRRLVHQLLHTKSRHRYRACPPKRGIPTNTDRQATVLRTHPDLHRPTRCARRILDRTINVLAPSSAMRGVPIVGMEPPVPPSYVPRPPN